jgi:hypothetical protein
VRVAMTGPEFWAVLTWGAVMGAVVARLGDVIDAGLRLLDRLERWLDADDLDRAAAGRPTPPRLPRSHVRPVPRSTQEEADR